LQSPVPVHTPGFSVLFHIIQANDITYIAL
jgi:hypothetical protein